MRFRFHWGHGVILALFVFIIFILSFVYKATFLKEYNHPLVSEDYYKDDMIYQQEVERIENVRKLEKPIELNVLENGLTINFPEFFDGTKVKGILKLQKVDDEKKDFQIETKLIANSLHVPIEQLSKGIYNIKIIWHYDGKDYQLNKKINIR